MDVPETAFLVHAIHSSCKVVLGAMPPARPSQRIKRSSLLAFEQKNLSPRDSSCRLEI